MPHYGSILLYFIEVVKKLKKNWSSSKIEKKIEIELFISFDIFKTKFYKN